MDIQSAKKIIYPAVSNAISELESKNIYIKLTMLRSIFDEAINGALNIDHNKSSEIRAMFSGRGRAWARTNVDNSNPVWLSIKETLDYEASSAMTSSLMFKSCTNLLDLFENSNLAWMRFYSATKNTITFHLHIGGSQTQKFIKLRIDKDYLKYIDNLEGVPHKLGLESGKFNDEFLQKEKIEGTVSKEELNSLGIQTLEDLLGEG